MKHLTLAIVVAAAAVACGGGNQQAPPTEGGATASAPAGGAQGVEITLDQSQPVKAGENTFQVMVMQGGQPVTDADVSVQFYMAAMPQMKMAEMRNTVPLKHEGEGRYRGTGNVMMAGNWDATVMVMRNGQELGSRQVPIVAQ